MQYVMTIPTVCDPVLGDNGQLVREIDTFDGDKQSHNDYCTLSMFLLNCHLSTKRGYCRLLMLSPQTNLKQSELLILIMYT